MALSGQARSVDHLLEVGQILPPVSPLWRHARALLPSLGALCLLSLGVAVSYLTCFILSGARLVLLVLARLGTSTRLCLLLGRRLLHFERRWQLALLDESLLEQVVHCGHLVVLVAIQALRGVVLLKAVSFEVAEEGRLDRNLVLPDDQPLALADGLVGLVPGVLLDLGGGEALVGVGLEDLVDQVDALRGKALGHLELAAQDFLVQLRSGLVFKRQIAGHHGEKDDAARPDIDPRTVVLQPVDHLRCCVAGRATGRFQHLTLLVGVAEAEIDQSNILLMVEEQVLRLEVPVNDAQLVEVLDAADDLLEEFAGFGLLELLLLHDVVEELAPAHELHYQKQLLRRLNDFEQLDDVGMPDELQYVNFASHSLHVSISRDFALFEDFDRHLGKQKHYSLGWITYETRPGFVSLAVGAAWAGRF